MWVLDGSSQTFAAAEYEKIKRDAHVVRYEGKENNILMDFAIGMICRFSCANCSRRLL